jgi:hypothetical protein
MEKGHDGCLEQVLEEGVERCVGVCRVADVAVNVSVADGGEVSSLMVKECVEEVSGMEVSCAQLLHCWVLEPVLLGSAVWLVECAFKPVVSVYIVSFRCYLVSDGLCRSADGEG